MPKRPYIKPDPVLEDVITTFDEEVKTSDVVDTLKQTPATGYSKAENVVQPAAFMVVFSNGEVREKNYFQGLKCHCVNLRLEFYANPVSPDDMWEDVKARKEEYELTAGDEIPDKYYLVTDVDHFYNDIINCRSDYNQENVTMIVSNPCFEVWLYYSKRDDKFEGFEMPENKLKLSQCVKRFLNEKIPGGCNPKKAVFDIRTNIVNAKKNYDEDENGVPTIFASNMFIIAEEVLPFVENDIEAASS